MVRIGQMSAVLKSSENNPGGIYHQADFQVIGKKGKKATVNVKWLMKNGKIQGTSIKLSAGRGFGELLAILAEFQKAQEAPCENGECDRKSCKKTECKCHDCDVIIGQVNGNLPDGCSECDICCNS